MQPGTLVLFYLEEDAKNMSLERLYSTKARQGEIIDIVTEDKTEKYLIEYTSMMMTYQAAVPRELVMKANLRSWNEYVTDPLNPFKYSPITVIFYGGLLIAIYRYKTKISE